MNKACGVSRKPEKAEMIKIRTAAVHRALRRKLALGRIKTNSDMPHVSYKLFS